MDPTVFGDRLHTIAVLFVSLYLVGVNAEEGGRDEGREGGE